jgi:hypothetical protein
MYEIAKSSVHGFWFFMITNITLMYGTRHRRNNKLEKAIKKNEIQDENMPSFSFRSESTDPTFYDKILRNLNKDLDSPVSPSDDPNNVLGHIQIRYTTFSSILLFYPSPNL